MAASTEASPCASSSCQKGGKTQDCADATSQAEKPQNEHHHEAGRPTSELMKHVHQGPAPYIGAGITSNGQGNRRSAYVGRDGPSDGAGRDNRVDVEDRKTSNFSDATINNRQIDAGMRLQGASRPDSPADAATAASPAHRAMSSGSAPQSPKRATTAMAHGSFRPPSISSGPNSTTRQHHSHGGVSSPEGGLFGLLRRPPSSPYPPIPLRAPRSAGTGASGGGAILPSRPRRAVAAPSGAAIVASAAATVAAARPSPGVLIRYVLAPLVLLPVAWPWLLLRGAQALMTTACLLAAAAVEGLILLAELLRRNRGGAEVLTTWAAGWLGWVVVRYWVGLAQLHAGCEEALERIAQVVMPLISAAFSRSPVAARVIRLFSPLLAAMTKAQAMVYGAYCFVHDEIVPVALDLAERLPLVHGLLHRAVVGANA